MPELPDLEGYRAYFNRRLPGRRIQEARVTIPIVVRAPREEFARRLSGRVMGPVGRRGKYLLFALEGGELLVVHPMLAGRFQYCPAQEKRQPKTAFVLALEGGEELRYYDERVMGKAYLASEDDLPEQVPRWAEMGPDAMSHELGEEEFVSRLRGRQGQIKNILLNEQVVAGIGNAYADEILWEAGIHPFRRRSELSEEELARLYGAMRRVLAWATEVVAQRMEAQGLPVDEYRDHLRVHRRGGQPCPRCGTRISEITAGQRVTSFCRTCQGRG